MRVTIELEYREAVRLKPLIEMDKNVLRKQGRAQFGIDGFTREELNKVSDTLDKLEDSPKFSKPLDSYEV